MLPRCKWQLLPFAYVYDLFESWFPTVGLYEKPRNKTLFYDHLKGILKDNDEWKITDGYVEVNDDNMPLPEPLIKEYNLKNWMNKDCDPDDETSLCSPALNSKYMGIRKV
jgi:hypothetical protein